MIHRVTVADWALMAEVCTAAVTADPDAYTVPKSTLLSWREQDWKEWTTKFCSAGNIGLIAVGSDGRPSGIICGEHDEAGVPWLTNFWVAAGSRGTGLAEGLFRQLQQWAIDQGADHLLLWVAPTQERALGFYRRMGFEPTTAPAASLALRLTADLQR